MKKLLFISLFVLPLMLNAQVFNASSMRMPASGPTITLNPIFVNNFSNVTGTASAAQTVTVSWANLTTNVSVNALANFEYSYDGTTYASSLSIPRGPGNGDTLVYIRGTAAAATGTHTGNVQFSSTGATTLFLPVTCVVSASGTATITRSPTSYSGGTTTVGTPGPWQTATINGSNLTAGIGVTSPAGWELSFDNGVTNVSSGTIPQSGGTITNFILQFRLTGASVGSPSGNIALSSTGATTVNISVSGTVSSTGVTDTVVFKVNYTNTTVNVNDWINGAGDPSILTPFSITDNRNYQPVTVTEIHGKWTPRNSHAASNTGGISTSTIVPAAVGQGYHFNFTGASTWPGQTISDTNDIVSGLDPTQLYTDSIYIANNPSGISCSDQNVTVGFYDSTNFRADSITVNAKNNTSVWVVFQNKRPDANGNLRRGFYPQAGGNTANCRIYGIKNAEIIVKQAARR